MQLFDKLQDQNDDKNDHKFLILIILTTDLASRFHDEDYSITKLKRCNINGVTKNVSSN